MAITVNGAPVVSIPIAVCLFFMMYPIMVKDRFRRGDQGRQKRQAGVSDPVHQLGDQAFYHVCHRPFFSGYALLRLSSGRMPMDLVKMPFGLDLPVGAPTAPAPWFLVDGIKMLEVPLWRSYLAGCILLGIAPCTAMVLVWGFLSRGNDGLTLVMVAINSLTMLLLYGVLGGFLLGVGRLPVPWQALLLSIGIYVALPLVAGYFSRRWIIACQRRSVVQGEIPARAHSHHHHRPADHPGAAFLFQGRGHSGQPADHPLDRRAAVYPDGADLLLWDTAWRGC
jgi:ACR3 family arsenite transporter